MRNANPSIAILCVSSCLAATAAVASPTVVYLDGPKSLAELQVTHPTHYARAERIIAAATELCKPGPLESRYVGFEAKAISCADMLLKTSNPPKKELKFRLDDTLYIALVTVEVEGKLLPASR